MRVKRAIGVVAPALLGMILAFPASASAADSGVRANFSGFVLQTGTPLHETDDTFASLVADWDRDGRPDLIEVKKSATGTNSTEVHILSGASNFQRFVLQTGT
ncbi:VCBS repeat-containing protein, partial [Streptomyces sp. NPDC059850]